MEGTHFDNTLQKFKRFAFFGLLFEPENGERIFHNYLAANIER
jgi:hypothetical protein